MFRFPLSHESPLPRIDWFLICSANHRRFFSRLRLLNRLQMLEESLRDVELRAAQQLTEEQRRNKELIVRVEREKQLEIENCTIK